MRKPQEFNPLLSADIFEKPANHKTGKIVFAVAVIAVIFIIAIGLASSAYAEETTDPTLSFPRYRENPVSEVKQVQTALGLTPDGIFGPEVSKAIKSFQADYGLPVTGIVDQNTADYLGITLQTNFLCYEVNLNEVVNTYEDSVYLIYVNTYLKELTVFRHRYDGSWKALLGPVSCAVGASGQTPVGVFEIYDNSSEYFEHGRYLWCNPSFFNGEYGIHSVSYDPETEEWGTEALGESVSLGCVRVENSVANWIRLSCPIGTSVVIDDRAHR